MQKSSWPNSRIAALPSHIWLGILLNYKRADPLIVCYSTIISSSRYWTLGLATNHLQPTFLPTSHAALRHAMLGLEKRFRVAIFLRQRIIRTRYECFAHCVFFLCHFEMVCWGRRRRRRRKSLCTYGWVHKKRLKAKTRTTSSVVFGVYLSMHGTARVVELVKLFACTNNDAMA